MYDKVVYPCQSPEIEEFTTVVYKNGSGGYQCRSDDMIPRSRNELVGNLEMMEEAVALITAMAPPKAPKDLNIIFGQTGLKIIKNEYLANESVVVSEDLFDMIFNASTTQEKTSDGQ